MPEFVIILKPLQDNLRGPLGVEAIQQLVQYLPACPGIGIPLDLFTKGQLDCLPPGVNLAPITHLLASALADQFPAQITLSSSSQAWALVPGLSQSLAKIRTAYQTLRIGLDLGIRLSAFLFCLYTLLMATSLSIPPHQILRRFFRSLVWPLYAVGILSMILIFSGSLFFRPFLISAFNHNLIGSALDISPLLTNLLSSLACSIGRLCLWWATGFLTAGIFFHLLWLVIERSKQNRLLKV